MPPLTSHHPIADPFRSLWVETSLNGKPLSGFCDSQSGTVFRVRLMPTEPGEHHYRVTVGAQTFSGSFVWSGPGEPFFWNATTCYLMAGLSDEKIRTCRKSRDAHARSSAFSNVEWCLTNEWALFQSWDEYEDHYPGPWGGGRKAPARNADSRRRLAWEMVMAGCHQTTGESAESGAGGWINGLGDKDELLSYHQHLKTVFEAIPNWQTLQPTKRYVLESATHRVVYDPDMGEAQEETR